MKRMKNIRLGTLVACMCVLWGCEKPNVNIVMPQEASNRVLFAGEHLKKALEDGGNTENTWLKILCYAVKTLCLHSIIKS